MFGESIIYKYIYWIYIFVLSGQPCSTTTLSIAIAADGSSSLSAPQFEQQKHFVKELVNRIDISGSINAAFIQFATSGQVFIYCHDASTSSAFNRLLKQVSFMGGNTCIKCGLEKAGEALSKRGCGRTAEQKVILLLVEGNENVAGSNVYNTAAGLRSSGHLIYVMAIGKSVSLSSMTQIAGSRNRVFQTEFDDLATYDIERLYIALTSSFCTAYGKKF